MRHGSLGQGSLDEETMWYTSLEIRLKDGEGRIRRREKRANLKAASGMVHGYLSNHYHNVLSIVLRVAGFSRSNTISV